MTTFQLANKPHDYKKCHELLDRLGRTAQELSYPTILAYRGKELVGFISTANITKQKAIVLSELAVDPNIKRPQFLVAKLIASYEHFLWGRGIVSYLYSIDLEHKDWIERIRELGMIPYTQDSKRAWFNRRLTPETLH